MALPWAASRLPLRGGNAPIIVKGWHNPVGESKRRHFRAASPFLTVIYISSIHYQGADPQTVQKIFALLPPKGKTATFVDFGCGKGRVLILARQNGFKHVIGIEIAPELATICQRNLAKAPCTRDREQVQLIQSDAATFRPPPGVVCAFFFNPFHGPPLHRVISNLRENAECSRSEVWVIYVNPVHLNSFLEQGFKIIHSLTYRQNPLAVIAHLSASTLGEDAHL